jgi:hypothetical protein
LFCFSFCFSSNFDEEVLVINETIMRGVETKVSVLIIELKCLINQFLIKINLKKSQWRTVGPRVLTEEQALEFQEIYAQIPDNMLEFLGEYGFDEKNANRKHKNPSWKNWYEYLIRINKPQQTSLQ